jgi:hypothetical protein
MSQNGGVIGVSDYGGWAVLVGEGLPKLPLQRLVPAEIRG